MPDLPSWANLVEKLIDGAASDGVIDSPTKDALLAEQKDFLYVIDEIYSAVGKAQTKSKVAGIFSALQKPTSAHRIIVNTAYDRILTLNYDHGLEMAYAQEKSKHVQSITGDQQSEFDEWLRQTRPSKPPILHWHGQVGNSAGLILSGSDYVGYYDQNPYTKEALRHLFKTARVLMIGFGFTDPFIERELNSVMQPLPASNSHFAIIGVRKGQEINVPLERRKYTSKYKLEIVLYPVRDDDGTPDHSALLDILSHVEAQRSVDESTPGGDELSALSTEIAPSPPSYRGSLFSISGRSIYCEPNIRAEASQQPSSKALPRVSVTEILGSKGHVSVTAPHEYGLTNLGKRLASELIAVGKKALLRDASSIPKYRKAIEKDQELARNLGEGEFTLILDNFLVVDHQRTIRELLSSFGNIKLIVLQRNSQPGTLADSLAELEFTSYTLDGLSRSDVRLVVDTIKPGIGPDESSSVVDKVYSDLLQLCIPLTPSNVIMYASVLCKDESFSPVSRLHIVDRFVGEALKRPSDVYADAFNSWNKTDLISQFCYDRFSRNATNFTEQEWNSYCNIYKEERLFEFSATEILSDLLNGRIVVREGQLYTFRYKMFFSYFVGKHIAERPDLIANCIGENRHLELDGLLEVLCGNMPDCSAILDDLVSKFNESIQRFYEDYPIRGLDFHRDAKWEIESDDRHLWDAVSDGIEKGPATTAELDELKTSIHAERRTVDQKVSIIKFIASEKTVSANANSIKIALESAKQASASSKINATLALINVVALTYEVASIFIPLIAEKKYVSWNGFTYINLIENKADEDEGSRARMQDMVAFALPSSMGSNAGDHFGSRKLGPVFLALLDDASLETPLKQYVIFCLILRSKPSGWLRHLTKRVGSTKRDQLYLHHMLTVSLQQFRNEINTEEERKLLKELVASIRLRRDINIKVPSASDIKKAIGQLDAGGLFDGDEVVVES